GWRLEGDGWLIPPAQSHTARRLKSQRQLRECEKTLATMEKELSQAVEAAEKTDVQLEERQKAWQHMHLAMTEAQSTVKDTQATLDRQREASQSFASRVSHLEQEADAIQKDTVHWQQQRDGISELDQEKLNAAEQQLETQTSKQQQAEQHLYQVRNELAIAEQALALHQQAVATLKRDHNRLQQDQKEFNERLEKDRSLLIQTEKQITDAAEHQDLDRQLSMAAEHVELAHQTLNALRQTGHELQQHSHGCEKNEREARLSVQGVTEARQKIEVQQASEQARLQDLADEIVQRFQMSAVELRKCLEEEEPVQADEVLQKSQVLEERLNRFGPVNLLAIEEFQQASEREQFLAEQAGDLESSLATLVDTISRIDRTTKQRFKDVFDQTNAMFQKTFPRLFGGGRAELRLDSDDVLTAGVEVIAQPPGKHLGDISLMSGGEKALTAVALVFSIFRIKPAPFCILDEVDAPLDDANVGRFNEMIQELASEVQFLAITHNKITMQMADRLIGVSMPEPGVSKIVAVEVASH
ncbi:MAG: chromosome segregation protein SMC, partial [Mariprofundaceae bacterium]